jgi:transposase
MARPKTIIDSALADLAQKALDKLDDSGRAIKLQAIKSCASHPIQTVANIIGVQRQSVRNWILAFRKEGVAGLASKPKGHRKSKLDRERWAEVAGWIQRGQTPDAAAVHWTLEGLSRAICERFGVIIGATALWRQVHKMGFRLKVPRPVHAKADAQKQNDFKKKPLK